MSLSFGDLFRQNLFVPAPTFTEKEAPDQEGKIHLVTGGYSGCGYELAAMLFSRNATVYIAGRDAEKGRAAITRIEQLHPLSNGRLDFLKLDLADLNTIKRAVEEFMRKETKLHVLTNNAGVNAVPPEPRTPQGHNIQYSTNCLGPFLLTQCLLPILRRTAATEPPGTIRVTWAASFAVEINGPEGIPMGEDGEPKVGTDIDATYLATKVGNLFYSKEFARRYSKDGVISVGFNPGNMNSNIMRHFPSLKRSLMGYMFYPPKLGGYTELFAAISPDITTDLNGAYIFPWGRIGGLKQLKEAVEPKDNDRPGTGKATLFWDWSEKTIQRYLPDTS